MTWSDADGGHWVVCGHREARDVLERSDDFSSRQGSIPSVRYPFGPEIPLHSDGDEHRRQRHDVVAALRSEPLDDLGADARAVASDLAGCFAPGTELEFVGSFAEPFARVVFGRYLGVPMASINRLPDPPWDEESLGEALAVLKRSREFEGLHDQRRAGLTGIAERLRTSAASRGEFVRTLRFVYGAGVDTIREQLALVVLGLARAPDLRDLLTGRPELVPGAVDELLRHDSGIAVVRQANHATTVGDVEVAAGDLLLVLLNAANRDPAAFAEPDQVVLDRGRSPAHLAFGAGPHRCPGADVARELLTVALQAFQAEAPGYELAATSAPVLTFSPLRRVVTLPLQR